MSASVSHVTVPSNDAIADRAYAAMHRPPAARLAFQTILSLSGTARAIAWHAMDRDEQVACNVYTARRLDLREVYGEGAAQIQAREDCLAWLRSESNGVKPADKIAWVKRYYARDAETMADFINDWGYTIDPRLVDANVSSVLAFALWPKQREMIRWILGCLKDRKPGVVVKSRDVGASWVTMALLCTLCIFRNGFAAGVGSAVEIKIDRTGDPDTLFYKIRSFLEYLPAEFNAGFSEDKTSADKRVSFPLTGSSITGEAGDQAGRGGRKTIFIVDESAHFEHPKIIDKNLSRNTNCRIDLSSVNGMNNSFYVRAHNPAIRRFNFTTRDDPRITPELLAKMEAEMDPVTFAQEVMCDWRASLEGGIIPHEWAAACIDIDKFLGIEMGGAQRAALDIADRGNDLCAMAGLKGRRVNHLSQWSGKGSDTGYSVQKAMRIAEDLGLGSFEYDADGMGGAAVHSDARLINEARSETQAKLVKPTPGEYFAHGTIGTVPYRGSEAVIRPEAIVPGTKRKAKDMFANRKAQTWYEGRLACYAAWQARRGKPYDPERLLCIPSDLEHCDLLVNQLAQATAKETLTGKLQVDKNPDDVSSPDLADAVLMALAPRKASMSNMGSLLAAVGG
jgi:phage terminase large subunit